MVLLLVMTKDFPKKIGYILLALAVTSLGFILSLIPTGPKAAADVAVTNDDYCGIGGPGAMTEYCYSIGYAYYDSGGGDASSAGDAASASCGDAAGADCCSAS